MKRAVVIGGGIAGVAAGAYLSESCHVTLLEAESSLAYHTTGRSAATFLINYGGASARPLAAASLPYFEKDDSPFLDAPLLSHRGVMWISDVSEQPHLEEVADAGRTSGAGSQAIELAEALALVPALNPEFVTAAIYEPVASDIDVAGLHQAFVRTIRHNDSEVRVATPVTSLSPIGGAWQVVTGEETIICDVVINAAGAWGDVVAGLAGVPPVGLTPMRRTAFMVPGDDSYSKWPLVVDIGERFYFRPDGVQLLCSLAEEVPDIPGDPKPRMEDVALAIERINQATTLGIRTVNSEWTGLRTFAPDRHLVIGEEPTVPGFFWLVGQGGMGIATAPAYGELIASMVNEAPTPQTLLQAGVQPELTHPSRFRD